MLLLYPEVFWERVNDLIRQEKITQAELSLKCLMSERRIRSLSSSKRLPDVFEAMRMARVLNTTVEYLCTGSYSDGTDYKKKYERLKKKLTDIVIDER